MYIGVVGYSNQDFDQIKARKIIKSVFDIFEQYYSKEITVVSGLTAIGIPLIAYEEAKERCWKTIGIACKKANEYPQFPVDEKIIVGEDWGDESNTFIKIVDKLIRVGGGSQSISEVKKARNKGIAVLEFDL